MHNVIEFVYTSYTTLVFEVQILMKSTKDQNPWRNKCSAVVEKNCLVPSGRVPRRIQSAKL